MISFKAKIAISSLVVSSMILLLSGTVLAAPPTVDTNPPLPVSVTGAQGLVEIVGKVIGWIYTFFFVIAVIFILLAAFTYLTSAGDPTKVTSAKNQLIYAAVAIAIALLALSFTTIVKSIVGP